MGARVRAISSFGNRQVVVGDVGNAAFAQAYTLAGVSSWRVESPTDGLPQPEAVHAIGNTEAWVAGRRGGDVWIAHASDEAFTDLATHAGPAGGSDWAQAVVTVDTHVIVGGLESTTLASDAWLASFDIAGTEQWTYRPEPLPVPVNEELEGIAIDPEGKLVVVGFGIGDDRVAWIARVDPQTGLEIWHRRYPELPGPSTARGIAIAPDGTLYVVGELDGPDGTTDAWVAAFDP